jgi:hypothetical protein
LSPSRKKPGNKIHYFFLQEISEKSEKIWKNGVMTNFAKTTKQLMPIHHLSFPYIT